MGTLSALEHLRVLRKIVYQESSPFLPGIRATLGELEHALLQHERFLTGDKQEPSLAGIQMRANTPQRTHRNRTERTQTAHVGSETALG